jgi:hypothetical protein
MKKLLIVAGLFFSLLLTQDLTAQNLPVINRAKSTFYLEMEQSDDTPLIYGYATADVKTKPTICFSSFTVDVDGNPHKCALGAYYDTSSLDINFVGFSGDFVELKMTTETGNVTFFMEKKNVRFE